MTQGRHATMQIVRSSSEGGVTSGSVFAPVLPVCCFVFFCAINPSTAHMVSVPHLQHEYCGFACRNINFSSSLWKAPSNNREDLQERHRLTWNDCLVSTDNSLFPHAQGPHSDSRCRRLIHAETPTIANPRSGRCPLRFQVSASYAYGPKMRTVRTTRGLTPFFASRPVLSSFALQSALTVAIIADNRPKMVVRPDDCPLSPPVLIHRKDACWESGRRSLFQ